jgi:hypothetical protein
MKAALVIALSLALVSCGQDDPAPAPVDSATPVQPQPTPTPIRDLTAIDLPSLIYWQELFFESTALPPPRLAQIVEGLAAQDDPRYEAFLVDLALYPTPYRDMAFELLTQGRDFNPTEMLAIFGKRGKLTPGDDLPEYPQFKSRLLDTVVHGFGAFLDPAKPHTISAQEVIWGGVGIDGIPPLEDPNFVSAEMASNWMLPSDPVIGVEINGDARAYPRRIIDWHEMVNDVVGGVPVSLAYCTLCGSAVLYDGRLEGRTLRFGTSGLLYRSNKLMYDRETRTLWEQYSGEPVWGSLVGSGLRLEVLPAVHTRWSEWLAAHPETSVLDINTGFKRDYASGVAYADYWASLELRFPAPDASGPLSVKDTVFTVRHGGEVVAYPLQMLSERGFLHDRVAGTNVLVVATADGLGGRAFDRRNLEFSSFDKSAGTLTSRDGREWRITEDALLAGSNTLPRLPGHNSFWFAVVNHAPVWRLYED